MNVATDIIQTHFEKIMSTDTDGCIKLVWGLEERTIGHSLIKKIELIISLKGFIKGYDESNGRWMRKEDLIRIIRENPQWLRTNLVAQEYGI